MRIIILVLISTSYVSIYGWKHTFYNYTDNTIDVATKRRAAQSDGMGETVCHVTLNPGEFRSCEAGGKCPEIIQISKSGSSRKQIVDIDSWNKCQNFEIKVRKETNPIIAREFVVEQQGYIIK